MPVIVGAAPGGHPTRPVIRGQALVVHAAGAAACSAAVATIDERSAAAARSAASAAGPTRSRATPDHRRRPAHRSACACGGSSTAAAPTFRCSELCRPMSLLEPRHDATRVGSLSDQVGHGVDRARSVTALRWSASSSVGGRRPEDRVQQREWRHVRRAGSLPLPHLGDCTRTGSRRRNRQLSMSSRVASRWRAPAS